MKRVVLAALALGACSPPEDVAPAPTPDALDAIEAPVFEAVVNLQIARLEATVDRAGTEQRRAPEDGEPEALAEWVATAESEMRDVALEDASTLNDDALPALRAIVEDGELEPALRNAALYVTFAIGTPDALGTVVTVLESAPEAWRRSYAAWLLGQSDDDRFLLRMLLAMRYEKDPETVVWLTDALARCGNFAGLEGLARVASGSDRSAELARGKQQELVARADLGVDDIDSLRRLWTSAAAHEALTREPSDALRLAAWRELRELSSERFQLRGVDDARFALCRTGPWGARLVAQALADADPYIRLHAAQVLERMEARARPVADALVPLLLDARTAHAAAEALGAIGNPASLPFLRAALGAHRPHELRVAAARGLARLGDAAAAPDLRAIVADETESLDLRLAAAGALAVCDFDRTAVALLVTGLEDPLGDPQDCEVALERWLVASANEEDGELSKLLDAWNALTGPPALLRTREDTLDRLTARAELVRAFLEKTP